MLRLNNYVAVELYVREKLFNFHMTWLRAVLGQLILSQLNTVNNIG